MSSVGCCSSLTQVPALFVHDAVMARTASRCRLMTPPSCWLQRAPVRNQQPPGETCSSALAHAAPLATLSRPFATDCRQAWFAQRR